MSRLSRLEELEASLREYVTAEKTRIENEVSSLEAILSGRTGGRGIQQRARTILASVSKASIATYLSE